MPNASTSIASKDLSIIYIWKDLLKTPRATCQLKKGQLEWVVQHDVHIWYGVWAQFQALHCDFSAFPVRLGVSGSGCWSQTWKLWSQVIELIYSKSASDLIYQKRTHASYVSWKWDKNQKWAIDSGTGTEAAMGPEWWPFSKTQAMLAQLLQPSLQPITLTKPSLLSAALLLVLPPWRACSYGSSVFYVKEDRIINCPVFSYFGNLNSRLFPQWLKTVVNVFQLVRVDQAFQKSLVFFF